MENNSSFSAIFSVRAQKEITQAWKWYEERQTGLGDRFITEVRRRIQQIEQNPERFPTRYKSYKEAPVSVFPYLIIYRLNRKKRSARIVSVFLTSLNPKKKFK
jgi:plasmid stabilization system protein ParE